MMAALPPRLFGQLRGIIGGYLVDLILEEGAAGIARLIREGLEAKAELKAEEGAKVAQVVQRLEQWSL